MGKLDEMREWANRLGLGIENNYRASSGGRIYQMGDTCIIVLSSNLTPDAAADIIECECLRFSQRCGELREEIRTNDADSSPADTQGLCVESVASDAIICLED